VSELVTGGCHCGNLRVRLELARAATAYSPRACDCEFCRKHGVAWVSDPDGALRIQIIDDRELARYRQGSGSAEMLLCRVCGVVVAATYHSRHAAVNARVLDAAFAADQVVSPRLLSPDDKTQRWQALWFADVTFG
jgi:hypothetical protein